MTSNWRSGWQALRKTILDRDGRVCFKCGGYADAVDHIVPRSRGGTNDEYNLRAICSSCNSILGGKLKKGPVLPRARPSRWG
jgi:5-methylcytosine-specific restriction endonuclease McrA